MSISWARIFWTNVSLVILFFAPVQNLTGIFCTDLSKAPPSFDEVANSHPFFGNEDNALQRLFSKSVMDKLKVVLMDPCITNGTQITIECVTAVREKYHTVAMTLFANDVNGQKLHLVDKKEFVLYRNRIANQVSHGLRMLYELSCIMMCQTSLNMEEKGVFRALCADPCGKQVTCPAEKCESFGIFDHQYYCECSSDKKWEAELHECVPEDYSIIRQKEAEVSPYDARGCTASGPCDESGTFLCLTGATEKYVICVCLPHFKGEHCDDPVDACEEQVQHPLLPGGGMLAAGETACNANVDGNTCSSFLSSEADISYRCNCNEDFWVPNHELSYDNCLKRRTMCESVICVNGKCVTNDRATESHCICAPGYRGSTCTDWVGVWSDWSPWDKCSPACGDVRYAVRSRDCLSIRTGYDNQKDCLGSAVEYSQCSDHPCTRSEGTFLNTYFAIRQSAIASSISAAAIACAVVTGLWSIFCWRIISRITRAMIKRFQQGMGARHAINLNLSGGSEDSTVISGPPVS